MINKRLLMGVLTLLTMFFSASLSKAEYPLIQIKCRTIRWVSTGNAKYFPVHFIVVDSLGHRVGSDAFTGIKYKEMQGDYGTGGGVGIIDDDTEAVNSIPEYYVEATFGKPVNGNYFVEITGVKGGAIASYSFNVVVDRNLSESANAEFIGVVETGQRVKYIISYSSDPAKPVATVVKFADPAALKQDITTSYKMGLMDSDGVMNSLMSKANAIEASIAKGNKAAARSQLDALVNELNAQKDKHVASDAVKILIEDAQYIKDHL